MTTDIKILHASCCAKGSPIKAFIERVAIKNNLEVQIEELSELKDTMLYGTTTFPSLVIQGKTYDFKNYSTEQQLLTLL